MAHVAARRRAPRSAGCARIAARHPAVRDVRGAGLMWGLELDRPAAPVVEAALERGLLINRTADTVVRLLPPYVITDAEIDEALRLLDAGDRGGYGGSTGMTTVTLRTGCAGGRARPFTG